MISRLRSLSLSRARFLLVCVVVVVVVLRSIITIIIIIGMHVASWRRHPINNFNSTRLSLLLLLFLLLLLLLFFFIGTKKHN